MFETLNITHVLPEKEGKNWPNKLAKKENGNQFYEVHPNGLRRLCSHSLPIQTFKSSILDGRLIYTLYKDSWRQLQEASAPRDQGDSQIRDYGYGTSLTPFNCSPGRIMPGLFLCVYVFSGLFD